MNGGESPIQAAELGRPVPGWFGKIPALGDFASRRMPASFVAPWDAWLSQGLERVREALGEGWLDAYLSGPIWRFGLMPGVVDRHGWLGVLMPSVDRVGRYFPLTIAGAWSDPAPELAGLEAWFGQLCAIALDCLAPAASVETLEGALTGLPLPWGAVVPDPGVACAASPPGLPERLPTADGLHAALSAAAAPLLLSALQQRSLWWPWRIDQGCAPITICSGLPGPDAFAGLLEGSL
jgi:type VI secretion system protein ImpM